MSDEGASANGAAPNWAAIREEYEGRKFLPAVICKRYGISLAQLRYIGGKLRAGSVPALASCGRTGWWRGC